MSQTLTDGEILIDELVLRELDNLKAKGLLNSSEVMSLEKLSKILDMCKEREARRRGAPIDVSSKSNAELEALYSRGDEHDE
jgi:hypothetical protein